MIHEYDIQRSYMNIIYKNFYTISYDDNSPNINYKYIKD